MNLFQDKPTLIKLGISAIIVVLAVYLYFTLSPNNKNQVQVFVVPFNFGVSPNLPITTDNPVDPKSPKDYVSYEFADYSGKVLIKEYPNDPTQALQVTFQSSRESLNNEMPVTAEILGLGDTAEEALMRVYLQGYATTGIQNGVRRMAGLLRRTGPTADQRTKINTLNQNLTSDLESLELRFQQGSMYADELTQVKQALSAYLSAPGDPQTSAVKADLARNVLAAGKTYAEKYISDNQAILKTYLDNVTGLLNNNQKQFLDQSIQPWLARNKLN